MAVVLAAIVLHMTTDLIGTLERRFYDLASTTTARQPSDRIAVIARAEMALALSKPPQARYQNGAQSIKAHELPIFRPD